jgi:hypothetical protein
MADFCVRIGVANPYLMGALLMDDRIEQVIEQMLRRYIVRSDVWIAERVEGTSAEMVTTVRLKLESRGKLPHLSHYIDSNGRVWPRDTEHVTEAVA